MGSLRALLLLTSLPNSEGDAHRFSAIASESAGPEVREILGASASRWGIYQVRFPIPVMGDHDLVRNFVVVLPTLPDLR
jgi:hypothetical protein